MILGITANANLDTILWCIILGVFVFNGVALVFPSRRMALCVSGVSSLLLLACIFDFLLVFHLYGHGDRNFDNYAAKHDTYIIIGLSLVLIAVWARFILRKSKKPESVDSFTRQERIIGIVFLGFLGAFVLSAPGHIKARKQTLGRCLLSDARCMDAAVDQWALETRQPDGASINTTAATEYLKTAWPVHDPLGNPWIVGRVGTNQINIFPASKSVLGGASIDWGSY